mmetsp:Transcript_5149/g.14397  ORF Transcript_5149/g.14397 Transcript_5149/m.14397 type:complete len:300 (+) Transcript_5149:3614-4513(+)
MQKWWQTVHGGVSMRIVSLPQNRSQAGSVSLGVRLQRPIPAETHAVLPLQTLGSWGLDWLADFLRQRPGLRDDTQSLLVMELLEMLLTEGAMMPETSHASPALHRAWNSTPAWPLVLMLVVPVSVASLVWEAALRCWWISAVVPAAKMKASRFWSVPLQVGTRSSHWGEPLRMTASTAPLSLVARPDVGEPSHSGGHLAPQLMTCVPPCPCLQPHLMSSTCPAAFAKQRWAAVHLGSRVVLPGQLPEAPSLPMTVQRASGQLSAMLLQPRLWQCQPRPQQLIGCFVLCSKIRVAGFCAP